MKAKQWIALLLVVLLLAGCSAKTEMTGDNMSPAESYAYSEGVVMDRFWQAGNGYDEKADTESSQETVASSDDSTGVTNQKLIRTLDLSAETDALDILLGGLETKLRELGGYVENRSIRNGGRYSGESYRYANLTIRIPVDKLDSFANYVQGASNVVSFQESAKDVTLSYVATESRVKALETEQARLLELLAQAKDMSDLLTVESRLTDVRTELEEYASQLRLYDNLVDYGTVRLSVTEVTKFTPVEKESVWQRIGGGFMESLESLWSGITECFVFVIVNLPFILVWAVVITCAVLLIKGLFRRRKKKNQPAA